VVGKESMDQHRKILIQMSGPPGSGKSTTAKLLSKALDATIVDHDILKSFFLESDIFVHNDDPFDQSAKLAYKFQWVLAEELMKQDRSVIMDCVCNFSPVLENGAVLAQKYGYAYRYVEIRASSMELLDERLQQRLPLRSQRTGVYKPPADQSNGAIDSEEGYRVLFTKWMNPKRPSTGSIVVESTSSLEDRTSYILGQIACADNDIQSREELTEST
jgi:predicted kinase